MRVSLRREDGAVLLFFALVLLVLLGISAIAVDLAALRQDRRADRLASDIAATAGTASLDPFAGGSAQKACETAWAYVLENLRDEGTTIAPPDCTPFASVCDPLTARWVTGTAGPYTIHITQPVPNSHPLMTTQAIDPVADGGSCQRLGVEIIRDRQHTFARVMGIGSGSTHVASVARIGVGLGEGELVPLLVLEPIACNALYASGQGRLTVAFNGETPGYIVVDSDASKTTNPNRCGNNIYTIEAQGIQPEAWLRALPVPPPDRIESVILSYALSGAEGASPSHSFSPINPTQPIDSSLIADPSMEPADTWFRLYPVPAGSQRRITRAPIDWRYNCKTSYPPYLLDPSDPSLGSISIDPCPEAPGQRSYIDDLTPLLGPPGVAPGGYDTYGDEPTEPCTLAASDPPLTLPVRNWYVNCTGPQGFSVRNQVTFQGGNVVFEGAVNVIDGTLEINKGLPPSPPGSDHVVVIRNGSFSKTAQANLSLERTLIYLANGAIDFGGGSGNLLWTAPTGNLSNPAMFHPGNYEDLALWSESSIQHWLGGQAANVVEGTLFTPNALFTLAGQAGQFQTDAQFLVRRLQIGGQGEVRMTPDPERSTPIPIREIRLIR